ncbi:hypothetical protein FHETE_720 [Fusarium heterosporum]|uniref:Rhodopsin domain-containing protein n=1 Tax=Fusarium heterosporum TaxID=42747 RepID=A0A8H5U329_FUSHE|nr:hypothetical protein FHETE_720 [Fusarium heterosporum]
MDPSLQQFGNDSSRQWQLCVTSWTFTGLSALIVTVKLVSRVSVFRNAGWDDMMIFLAMVGSLGATSIIQVSVNLGFGRPLMAVVSEVGRVKNLVEIVRLSRIGYRLSAIFTTIKVYNMIDFYGRNSSDIIYDVVPLILWGLIEQNVVIIAACVPTLRPLLHLAKHKASSQDRALTAQRPSAPERCSSTSEVPLGDLKYGAHRRSEPSLEALSGSEDWDGRPATARYK